MFVRVCLKPKRDMYSYQDVSLLYIGYHTFPSGKERKCLSVITSEGNTINFAFADVFDLIVENHKDECHLWNDDAKIIFVEDGQVYEKR